MQCNNPMLSPLSHWTPRSSCHHSVRGRFVQEMTRNICWLRTGNCFLIRGDTSLMSSTDLTSLVIDCVEYLRAVDVSARNVESTSFKWHLPITYTVSHACTKSGCQFPDSFDLFSHRKPLAFQLCSRREPAPWGYRTLSIPADWWSWLPEDVLSLRP